MKETTPSSTHRHCCDECGTIWQHDDVTQYECEVIVDLAHQCPRCSQFQFWKYRGEGTPEYIDHHKEVYAKLDNDTLQVLRKAHEMGGDAEWEEDSH